jgi:hypothetical protein
MNRHFNRTSPSVFEQTSGEGRREIAKAWVPVLSLLSPSDDAGA